MKNLLKRLSITSGIRDLPLLWLTSYLSDRSAFVVFHSSRWSWRHTPFGLPQGSVLGLFSIFYLLQILALFSKIVLSQVILMSKAFTSYMHMYKLRGDKRKKNIACGVTGQNGIRTKCHWTKWYGQNGTDKMVRTKW